MADNPTQTLSSRQQKILAQVVEEYSSTGSPVGSKTLVERSGLDVSSSTVRYELAVLEEHGLLMHPHTSAGRVPKRLFAFEETVDPRLAEWAAEYLNERLAGLQLGARLLRSRFEDAELNARERDFLDVLRPAFTDALEAGEQSLYIGGTAGGLDEVPGEGLNAYRRALAGLRQRGPRPRPRPPVPAPEQ